MKKAIISLIICAAVILPVVSVMAQDGKVKVDSQSTTSLTNPLCPPGSPSCAEGTSVPTLIGKVIKAALGIVGSLALLMFIYGGFMWMLSGGNEKMIEKGKTTLMWAALGLVLIFTSYALVNFVITTATSKG